MHLDVGDCSVLLLSNSDLKLWSQLYKNRVLSISSIFYDIELTNLATVCHLLVSDFVTLTSSYISRLVELGQYMYII